MSTTGTRVSVRTTYETNIGLYVLDCPDCGVVFAITLAYEDRRREDGAQFYCPNGHTMSWDGKAKEDQVARERKRAQELERQLASREEDVRAARTALRVTKGQLTKARNRADKGVCQHCRRSFANVARHVETQHPEKVST